MLRNVTFILVVLLLGVSSGCKKKELEALRNENKELTQRIEEKNSTIETLKKQYNQIEQKLQLIIQAGEDAESLDFSDVTSDNLRERLENVSDMVRTNTGKAESLRNELNGARYQANKYRKRASQLENEVNELNDSLKTINEDLTAKKERVNDILSEMEEQEAAFSKLTEENKALKDSLEEKNKLLNTAYYAVGPEKKLKDDDVIMKKGGFLGFIGQTSVLHPEFSQSDFYIFDKSTERTITIEARKRKVEVVTPHPKNSYDLEEEGEKTILNINDQEKFWKAGKYLVVTY